MPFEVLSIAWYLKFGSSVTSRTFNDAFGDLIRHLKFQMRKVLETRNLNQATRLSPPEGRGWLGTRLDRPVVDRRLRDLAFIMGAGRNHHLKNFARLFVVTKRTRKKCVKA